jgi:hypothetical protein
MWADLSRQLGPTALDSTAGATYDLLEKLLAAQREIVDELVAIQRQFAQGLFDTTTGDGSPLGRTSPAGASRNPMTLALACDPCPQSDHPPRDIPRQTALGPTESHTPVGSERASSLADRESKPLSPAPRRVFGSQHRLPQKVLPR